MRKLPLLLALVFLSSCQHAANVAQPPTITHIVIFYLKTPGDAAARQKFIDGTHSLASIPGLLDIHVGTSLPSTRPVVDSSFDVAISMTFADEASLANYVHHPDHERLVKELIGPYVDHYRVYDFRNK
jgi:hypothetical protein